jgi:SAM-dependent methyltransferase
VLEFTGERVVPGEVESDLWNEHVSRYRFAAQFAKDRTLVDIGCGAGYGAEMLARCARSVRAFDVSDEAIDWAREHYQAKNLQFDRHACDSLPVESATVELAVAFELIEHLAEPESLLREARRILVPQGWFLVSTPNATYYDESRIDAGPNPFHAREYKLDEFRDLLHRHFPFVAILSQNHTPAITFQVLERESTSLAHVESLPVQEPNFFVAVCAANPLPEIPSFVFVPSAGNVLRERETHIRRLKSEMEQKQGWLERSLAEHSALVDEHRRQKEELEKANAWAKQRDAEINEQAVYVVRLASELETANNWAKDRDAAYQEKSAHVATLIDEIEALKQIIRGLQEELRSQTEAALQMKHVLEGEIESQRLVLLNLQREFDERTQWALDLEAELRSKSTELAQAVDILHDVEADRDRQTAWALALNAEREALITKLADVARSRWVRLGNRINLGPKLTP